MDGIPLILSGATHEIRDAERRNETQQGLRLTTQWVFDERPYWVKLAPSSSDRPQEMVAEFVRSNDDARACTVVLKTGQPAQPQANCGAN